LDTTTNVIKKVCVAKITDLFTQYRPFKVAEALSHAGYKCVIVGLGSVDGNVITTKENISIHTVDTIFNNYPSIFRPFRILTKFIKYIIYMYLSKADIYCVHDVISIAIACIIKIFKPIRIVYIGDELEYSRTSDSYFSSLKNYIVKWFLKIAFKYCDVIMQADITRADALADLYKLKKVYYLRNVADKKLEFNPINLRKKFSLPLDTIILLYHGTLGFGRGIEKTIQSLYKLDSSIHITFIIIGFGSKKYLRDLNRIIKSNNNSNRKIIISNGVDSNAIWNWIAGADIGMAIIENTSLSYYLSAPSKLYEYMMAGVPVIFSDFPENQLVVKNSNCGLLVNPENIEELQESIIQLSQNPELRNQLGNNGRRSALSTYNWEEEQKILIKVIGDISG
jgi:glycosyltransferase involved in cell wall biosynthesis